MLRRVGEFPPGPGLASLLDFGGTCPKIARRMPRGSRRTWILLAVWSAAFIVALLLDRRVAEWVQQARPLSKGGTWAWWLKLPGDFRFTIILAVVLALSQRRCLAPALALLLSGPLVGIVYITLKWGIGRHRPVIAIAPFAVHPFAHGLRGLFGAEKALSFPSGHAALAFATATCLTAALPRGWLLFFAFAAAVATERVLENAHYLSDVVAGAGFGVCCGLLSLRLVFPSRQPRPAADVEEARRPVRTSSNRQ